MVQVPANRIRDDFLNDFQLRQREPLEAARTSRIDVFAAEAISGRSFSARRVWNRWPGVNQNRPEP
jgi:hypothetical protein